MKRLIQIITLILFISSCSKNDDDVSIDPKIKSSTIYYWIFAYDNPDSVKEIWSSKEFDIDGKLLVYNYRSTSNFISKRVSLKSEVYKYENGLKSEMIEDQIHHFYTYSDKNLVLEEIYNTDGLWEKNVYYYSPGSKKPYLRENWWDDFEREPFEYHYSYDSKGNNVKDSIHYSKQVLGRIHREFDQFNNVTKEIYFSGETDVLSIRKLCRYKYDSNDSIVEFIINSSTNNTIFQKQIYYRSSDKLIEKADLYESYNGIDGDYRLVGKLEYEYSFYQ